MARIHTLGATNRRRSRRDGLRALVIVTMCGCLLLGLAACTLVGNSATTSARVLNSDAPVPSGSGLYSLQRATDNRVGQFTLVRLDAVTGKPQWQQALPGNDLDPLIGVSDGIFYAVNGLDVLAFSGRDGSSIWHTTLNPSVHA